MANSDKFKKWIKLEYMKRTGELVEAERALERELKKVKVEVKIDGKWVQVSENQLVDDPDTFDTSFLKESPNGQ